MKIETNTRMAGIQFKIRAETGAKVLMEGQFPEDLTRMEQVVAQRLAELWKQGEQSAMVHVDWHLEGEKIIHTIGIKRADGTLENYGSDQEKTMPHEANSPKPDYVNHPPHYATHPSGVECVDIAEHLSFNLGNALKYLWRAKMKDEHIENLEKCLWYLEREDRHLRLRNEVPEVSVAARLYIQKTIDKEGIHSALGKFLAAIGAYPHEANFLEPKGDGKENVGCQLAKTLMGIVRAEIKIVKAGDSR
jgi:hypothetical protein